MLITQISLANTFSDWLISTQHLIDNSNTLETGNYYKTGNTLYITADGSDVNGTPTALYVNNHAYFGSISIGGGTFGGGNLSANWIFANNMLSYESSSANNIYANNAYIQYDTRTFNLYADSVFANNVNSANGNFSNLAANNLRANTANVSDLYVANSLNFGPFITLPDVFSVGNTLTMGIRTPQSNAQIVIFRGENTNPSNANATLRWAESDGKWKIRDINSPTTYYDILLDNSDYIRPAKLGSGVPTFQTYLAGDGVWRTIDVAEGGPQAVANTFYPIRESFTASNNQTIFTTTNGYIPYHIDVYYNGSKLVNGIDVDVSNGSIVTLTTGASTDAVVEVVGFKLSTSNSGILLANTSANFNFNVPLTTANSGIIVDGFIADERPLQYNAGTGNLYANNAVYALGIQLTSDLAIKHNIQPLTNSVNVIKTLNPVEFNYNSDNSKSYGVIAQEIEQILPELVKEFDGIKSVNYTPLIAFLLEAVKELDNRLQNLENK